MPSRSVVCCRSGQLRFPSYRLWLKLALVTVVLSLFQIGVLCAAIVSDFSTGTDGWLLSGDTTTALPTHVPLGGNPGGYINGTDLTVGGVWYWDAPVKFLGNVSAAYGQPLTFDLRMRGSGPIFADSDVILAGAGLSLHFDTSPVPQNLLWTSYSVLLSESSGWKVGSLAGPTPTPAEFQSVLFDLDRLRIRGEFITGSDNGDLDNVTLNGNFASVPVPASLAIWGLGVLGVGMIVRRRKDVT